MSILKSIKHWVKEQNTAAQMQQNILTLIDDHKKCCGVGAKWALERCPQWHSTGFNWALQQAYLESERLECPLSGFLRKFVIYYWVLKHSGWQ
jgi:hypothetical protein